jgi:hypothetical protein
MNFTDRSLERAIDYIYQNSKPDGRYVCTQTLRTPVRRFTSPEVAKIATREMAYAICPDADISPGYFQWYLFLLGIHRVYTITIQFTGTRQDMVNLMRAGYELWTGKEAS